MLSTDLPPHEDVVAVAQRLVVKVVRVKTFGIFVKGLKLSLVTKNKEETTIKQDVRIGRLVDGLVLNGSRPPQPLRSLPSVSGPHPHLRPTSWLEKASFC